MRIPGSLSNVLYIDLFLLSALVFVERVGDFSWSLNWHVPTWTLQKNVSNSSQTSLFGLNPTG